MEAFKIDQNERATLANVFISSKLFPTDVKLIILAYAGLMRVTKKHVCWSIYNQPPFFYRYRLNGKKKSRWNKLVMSIYAKNKKAGLPAAMRKAKSRYRKKK